MLKTPIECVLLLPYTLDFKVLTLSLYFKLVSLSYILIERFPCQRVLLIVMQMLSTPMNDSPSAKMPFSCGCLCASTRPFYLTVQISKPSVTSGLLIAGQSWSIKSDRR